MSRYFAYKEESFDSPQPRNGVQWRVQNTLLLHHSPKNGAFPGRQTIIYMTGHCDSAVRKALKDLELRGCIAAKETPGKKTVYYLPVDDKNNYVGAFSKNIKEDSPYLVYRNPALNEVKGGLNQSTTLPQMSQNPASNELNYPASNEAPKELLQKPNKAGIEGIGEGEQKIENSKYSHPNNLLTTNKQIKEQPLLPAINGRCPAISEEEERREAERRRHSFEEYDKQESGKAKNILATGEGS